MRLKISHRTEYAYTSPNNYALQRIRLTPRSCETQRVLSWSIKVDGAQEEVRYNDQFGNDTRLLSAHGAAHNIAIIAEGEVETRDTAGISGPPEGFAPLWLFKARDRSDWPRRQTAIACSLYRCRRRSRPATRADERHQWRRGL